MIGCRVFFIWFLIERHEPIPGCFRWKKETFIFNIYIYKTCININFTKMFTSTPTPPLYLRPPNLSQLYRKDTRSSDCPWSFNLHFHSKELSSSDGIWNKDFNVDCPWYNRYFSGLSDRGQKIFFWCPLQIECFSKLTWEGLSKLRLNMVYLFLCCLTSWHTVVYSGNPMDNNTFDKGVGYVLTKKARRSLLECDAVSARILIEMVDIKFRRPR